MDQSPDPAATPGAQPTPHGKPSADVAELLTTWLHELVGQPLWSATVWHGSMVDIDLGGLSRRDLPALRGERQLWLGMANWCISERGDTIATCEDDPQRMQTGFNRLLGSTVVGVHQHGLDAFCLLFPDVLVLRVCPAGCAGEDDWELFRNRDSIIARDGALTLEHDDDPTPDGREASGVTTPATQHPAAPGILMHAGRASGILLMPGEADGALPGSEMWRSILDDAWGTWLDAWRFDPFRGELVMLSTLHEAEVTCVLETRFTDVRMIRFDNDLDLPLETIEVTEIWGRHTDAGRMDVQVLMWSDRMTLTLQCADATCRRVEEGT